MAKYTDNSIQFNSIDTSISQNNKKWGNENMQNATDADLIDIATENGGKLPTIVNAVEIDWNGAKSESDYLRQWLAKVGQFAKS